MEEITDDLKVEYDCTVDEQYSSIQETICLEINGERVSLDRSEAGELVDFINKSFGWDY